MITSRQRTSLIKQAIAIQDLGWIIGCVKKKTLLSTGAWYNNYGRDEWDGISVCIDTNLVVVDIDYKDGEEDLFQRGYYLPPTLKERSPKGVHLYYNLPKLSSTNKKSIIKWRPKVDLLTSCGTYAKYKDRTPHVVCSPTPGYELVWPNNWPHRNSPVVATAPDWVVDAVTLPRYTTLF